MLCLLAVPGLAAQPYMRQVDAFPVLDASGTAYTHPWLGGLNVPRPQFLDLDADGDLDVFVQERAGALMFFENTGSPAAPRFVWRTDTFADLEVNEWTRFADLDADGDFDVLAEEPFGLLRYYRNDGTPQAAAFTLVADTLRDTAGNPIFSDRQNLPALADLDCDGRVDLFIADLNGYLTYYANEGADDDGMPQFRFITDRYEDLEIIGGFGKNTPSALRSPPSAVEEHGANAIAFADLEGDGDLDLFWGDFFSPSLYFIENTGTCEAPALGLVTDLFPFADPMQTRGFNVPAFADLDADGDADLFAGVLGGAFAGGPTAANNFYYYRHDADGAFSLQSRQFISSLDVDEESMPALADLDADGDLDLLVGNKIDPHLGQRAQLFLFENEGIPGAPAFRLVGDLLDAFDPALTNRLFNIAPAAADLNADGDVDVLLGRFDGTFALLDNTGTPEQPAFTLIYSRDATLFAEPEVDIGQNSTPAFADLDDDGDLDLIVGEAAGTVNFFRNTGTPEQPRFVLEVENVGGLDAGARSIPTVHDVTGDGIPDLVVGTGQDGVRVYRNTGTVQAVSFADDGMFPVTGTVPLLAAPLFADLDGDADADFLMGGLGGGLFFYRNEAVGTATEGPSSPSAFLVSVYPNPFQDAPILRFRLTRPGPVRLVVYDVWGRVVAVPVDGLMRSGEHHVPFTAQGLPSGVYLYRLTTDDGTTAVGSMVRRR